MNEHEQYMADFMTVFRGLERWGPGSDDDTLKALSLVPSQPNQVIDIGCGKGFSTSVLAQHTQAHITAVDNEQSALDALGQRLADENRADRVTLTCASMTELPFAPASFDLIWAEASAYVMGVEQALQQWRPILKPNGYMVISDLVWLSDNPSATAQAFWKGEYPDMQTVATRLTQMQQAGYKVIEHFTLSEQAWRDYYQPLKARVAELKSSMPDSAALADIEHEIGIYEDHLGEFGYHMFVLQKV